MSRSVWPRVEIREPAELERDLLSPRAARRFLLLSRYFPNVARRAV